MRNVGSFLTIINIPLTLSSTAPTSMMPEVSGAYARGDLKTAKEKIDKATWLSMFISIPCSVGLFCTGRSDYCTFYFRPQTVPQAF